MASFNKLNPKSIVQSARHELLSRILSGELKPDAWLPPERDIAAAMGVSRACIHQAILELEYQGFVSIVPRRGTRVNDYRKHPTPQSLTALMETDSVELDYSLFRDMMDTRLWLESECARRACTHIYDSTLGEMQEIVDRLPEPQADLAELIYSFHYKLTQASGNGVYSMIFRAFEPVIRALIRQHYIERPEDIELSVEMHRQLLSHIRAEDEKAAADCVCAIINQGVTVLEERY